MDEKELGLDSSILVNDSGELADNQVSDNISELAEGDTGNTGSTEDERDPVEIVPNNYKDLVAVNDPRLYIGPTSPDPRVYRWWVNTVDDKTPENDEDYSEGNTPTKIVVLEYENGKWQTTTPGGYTLTGTQMGKLEQIQEGSTRVVVYDNLTTTPFHPMKALSANQGYVLDQKIKELKEYVEEQIAAINARIDAINSCNCDLSSINSCNCE